MEEQDIPQSLLHYSKHSGTFRDSPSLILPLGTKLGVIYLHSLPCASKLNSSIVILLEQIIPSSLITQITIGFERLVSSGTAEPIFNWGGGA